MTDGKLIFQDSFALYHPHAIDDDDAASLGRRCFQAQPRCLLYFHRPITVSRRGIIGPFRRAIAFHYFAFLNITADNSDYFISLIHLLTMLMLPVAMIYFAMAAPQLYHERPMSTTQREKSQTLRFYFAEEARHYIIIIGYNTFCSNYFLANDT